MLTLTYDDVAEVPDYQKTLGHDFDRAVEALGGVTAWKARGRSPTEMQSAGVLADFIAWVWMQKLAQDDRRRLVLFAARCAEAALPEFETEIVGDDNPRGAVNAALAWVAAPTDENEMQATVAATVATTAFMNTGKKLGASAVSAAVSAANAAIAKTDSEAQGVAIEAVFAAAYAGVDTIAILEAVLREDM